MSGITIRMVPAECNVGSHLVDLALVREAIASSVGQELQAFVVGEHGVFEALRASLVPNKCLES